MITYIRYEVLNNIYLYNALNVIILLFNAIYIY